MPDQAFPSDINPTDRILPTTPLGTGPQGTNVPTQPFSSFMQAPGASPMATAGKSSMISPFDLAHGQPPLAQAPTLDTLVAQVNSAQSTMGDLSQHLSYPNLKLKSSQKYLLKNKLSSANTTLRAANAKMGGAIPEPPDPSKFTGPFGKFMAYLSDGEGQLQAAKNQLQDLKKKGANLTPGDFLTVQVKLGKAQQELDFSSVLLSNVVQDIKMMMQVQL